MLWWANLVIKVRCVVSVQHTLGISFVHIYACIIGRKPQRHILCSAGVVCTDRHRVWWYHNCCIFFVNIFKTCKYKYQQSFLLEKQTSFSIVVQSTKGRYVIAWTSGKEKKNPWRWNKPLGTFQLESTFCPLLVQALNTLVPHFPCYFRSNPGNGETRQNRSQLHNSAYSNQTTSPKCSPEANQGEHGVVYLFKDIL